MKTLMYVVLSQLQPTVWLLMRPLNRNRYTIFTLLTIQTLSMAEGLQTSFPIGLSLGHKFLYALHVLGQPNTPHGRND